MYKLVKTKLQRLILLIGGFLIFLRLLDVNYYNRHNAILTSLGILVLTIVLLIVLQEYHPKFHLKIIRFIKKYNRLLIYFAVFVLLIVLVLIGRNGYLDIQEKELIRSQKLKFHNAETSYQNCLDKVASLTTLREPPEPKKGEPIRLWQKRENKYFDEWKSVGSPYYDMSLDYWEVGFMKWMMENYSEFCSEYNIELIDYFLLRKETLDKGRN